MNNQLAIPNQEFIFAARDRVDGLIRWRPQIEKALARNHTFFGYEECCQRVLAGSLLWFDNDEGFMIVEAITFAKGTTLHILVAGGDYTHLCKIEEQLVALCKSLGIKRITTLARDGFKRRAKPNGWKASEQTFFYKEIE